MNSTSIAPKIKNLQFPTGTTELAGLIRHFDWSATDLGPLSSWPQYLRTAVDIVVQSPVPMILLCGSTGIMVYNDGYSEIAGLRHPGMLGGKVLEEWPEIADFNRNVLDVCLAGGTLTYFDQHLTLLRNRVPEQTWFNIYYSPVLDSSGVPEAVLAVVNETTGRVMTEQQRDQAEQSLRSSNQALKHANADLEQFAFSASHDLQEPLRMVTVYSQLLKRKLADKLDTETEILLRHCVEGADRLDRLIKGLLEYTRASSDAISDPPAVSLDDILRHTLGVLRSSIEDSSAAITCNSLPALHIQPIHAQQILQNLISNAIKYRAARPLKIHVAASRGQGNWVFSITDNGIGLDAAYKEQIFGLFKRLHGSSEYSGTGLGLAICRKLVERYCGRIWVDSVLGQGSTFSFTLPLAE